MKKLLAGGTLAVLAFGGMIATASPASAHTPEVTADCGWVDVNLRAYQQAKVTVVIDDAVVHEAEFSGQFAQKFEGLALDAAHDWTVTVDAYDGQDGTQFDWSESGSIEPCVEASPSPEPTPSVPTEPEPTEPPVTEPEPTEEPTDDASVAPAPVPSDEPTASPSPAAEEPPVLAATGATVGGAIAFAALLAVGGIALVWARKRMQSA